MRKGKWFLKLLLGVALLAMSAAVAAAEEAPKFKAPKAAVAGGVIKGQRAGGISVYKGIPYAKPPVGELRFAPPENAEPWEGELDCTRFGAQCFQIPLPVGDEPFSEDCLTLNVWTPAQPGEGAKLPVYVFIHGGGFSSGSGAFPLYDGTGFAKKGIVTVTINYRLGVLGFFASRETLKRYGTTGNWGLLDQIKALEWVRDNIAAFGGDRGKVTIGGESAGSFSVSALATSPLAKGLFRGVIMESGSVLSLPAFSYYSRADLRKSIGASSFLADIFSAGDDAEGLAKMRKADAETLARLCAFSADQTAAPFFLTPAIDGRVIPKDPLKAMGSGELAGVNFLLGFNNDEGSLFVPADTDDGGCKALIARIFGGQNMLSVLGRFGVDAQNTYQQRARQLLAYGFFSAGTKRFADIAADVGSGVYMYKFKYVYIPPVNGLGAPHAAELPFVFNTLALLGLSDPEAVKLADETHTRWANFIKTGDPNVGEMPPSAVKWPKYDSKDTNVLYLDKRITSGALEDKENIDFIADLTLGARK
ncbi:MAG: carboxylesterase family protein [Acidaminococcales bacterium]|jgi:para-nitrobenzyl esterase|nr:carboxylesterase family protein [Acidaminococcales bacterium]